MAARYMLLLLPVLALAKIDIEVSGKFDPEFPENLGVYLTGSEAGVITDKERATFNLGDSNLKNGVRAYFGRRPDDAYLRSPTPWGDLYKTYGWNQVVRSLVPKRARILKISAQPQIVMQQIFENNSSKPATFNVGISQSVQNTVSSSWSKGEDLSISQDIGYEIKVEGVGGTGMTTKLSYSSSYGVNNQKSQTVTVGSSSEMQLLLQPGQSVVSLLQATKGTITIEVEYEASLSGSTAVNYSNTYKGHHFWSLDINSVMSHGGLENRVMSKEVIEIGFFSDAKVIVNDRKSEYKWLEVSF